MNNDYGKYGINFALQSIDFTVNNEYAKGKPDTFMPAKRKLRKGSYRDLNLYFVSNLYKNLLGYCYFPTGNSQTLFLAARLHRTTWVAQQLTRQDIGSACSTCSRMRTVLAVVILSKTLQDRRLLRVDAQLEKTLVPDVEDWTASITTVSRMHHSRVHS